MDSIDVLYLVLLFMCIAVSAFFSSAEDCHLFVADASNSRIVELEPDGTFLFQYRMGQGDMLQHVRSLYVDDTDNQFYLLTNDELYRVPIPR